MAECPTEDQLVAHLLGSSAEADAARVREHIPSCPTCQAWIEDARANDAILETVQRVLDERDSRETTTFTRRSMRVDRRAASSRRPPRTRDPAADAPESLGARAGDGGQASIGPRIEGYTIHEELGRGGMGVVYRATQASTKRSVALKVLRDGPLASRSAKRRFEREVELVAQLAHPHIVTILESGITRGLYYFAMAYIDGEPLDVFAAAHRVTRSRLLERFTMICRAVNYAHQRGIIHRDLKPSNILIDRDEHPQILDFGLAKPHGDSTAPSADRSLISLDGQVMGTLAYMAPEQALGRLDEVDIRTDVYALGVILYELLTGRHPHPLTGTLPELLDRIAYGDPPKPSTIAVRLDDDLETIVLKALSRDKDHRYQSADNLARDVESYLDGRPIEAKRDSAWYVVRKTIGRHRRRVLAASMAFVVLASALVTFFIQRVQLDHATAGQIMSALGATPGAAAQRLQTASARVARLLADQSARYVDSPASAERVMGVRSAVFANLDAFWESVDGGPIWQHGEWLELCDLRSVDPQPLLQQCDNMVRRGTDRQKYVAFCLIGSLAGADATLAERCVDAVGKEIHPGVVAAAHWAAARLDRPAGLVSRERMMVDDFSLLTYVHIDAPQSFRRGSDADDPDRMPDEERPDDGIAIAAFALSTTEVTIAAFEPFFLDPMRTPLPDEELYSAERGSQFARAKHSEPERTAVRWTSHALAKRYCAWLSARANERGLNKRYRLPTEDEWEYACRAGNIGRFCYGDDTKYLPRFAKCNGIPTTVQTVAERMPSFFGLFDMHGGLWEHVDARYPAGFAESPEHARQDLRVLRGGAYYSPAVRCRSAQRNYVAYNVTNPYAGFRVVMERMTP